MISKCVTALLNNHHHAWRHPWWNSTDAPIWFRCAKSHSSIGLPQNCAKPYSWKPEQLVAKLGQDMITAVLRVVPCVTLLCTSLPSHTLYSWPSEQNGYHRSSVRNALRQEIDSSLMRKSLTPFELKDYSVKPNKLALTKASKPSLFDSSRENAKYNQVKSHCFNELEPLCFRNIT